MLRRGTSSPHCYTSKPSIRYMISCTSTSASRRAFTATRSSATAPLQIEYSHALRQWMFNELGITVNSKKRKNKKQDAVSIGQKKESFIGA
eukprot:jgi/Tetstr1/434110/TSEL_023254.t1